MKYFVWFIGSIAFTAVELYQKIVLTQSHIYIQLYNANATGAQKSTDNIIKKKYNLRKFTKLDQSIVT